MYPRSGGIFYACFNSIDSDKRSARKAVIAKLGEEAWKRIKRVNKTGLLAMFNVPPTPETELFANEIAKRAESRFENEDKWMFDEPKEVPK